MSKTSHVQTEPWTSLPESAFPTILPILVMQLRSSGTQAPNLAVMLNSSTKSKVMRISGFVDKPYHLKQPLKIHNKRV